MKVKELVEKLKTLSTFGHGDDIVAIPLQEPSVGPRSKTEVTGLFAGFDWDARVIFLETNEHITKAGRAMNDELDMDKFFYPANGKTSSKDRVTLHCPKCGQRVFKKDNYCSHCGQHIKYNEDSAMIMAGGYK